MTPPIYTPDGSEVSEIVLPDGSTASQVIGPDGSVVFEAGPDIPDSVDNHWPFDQDNGSGVNDQIGSLDSTSFAGNPTWVSDSNAVNGYYLALDGDDGVNLPDGAFSYIDSSNYTLTAWVYHTGSSSEQTILNNDDGDTDGFFWEINTEDYLSMGHTGIGGFRGSTSTVQVPQNQWVFVAVRYDNSNSEIEFIADTTSTTKSLGGMPSISSTTSSAIGYDNNNNEQYINGRLDEMTACDGLLTDSEIDSLRNKR